jgi:hypothetical protein
MKKTIRLKESELRRMISESVRRVLRENYSYPSSWESDLATTADSMRYWGFDAEADMIEDYLDNDGGKTCNMEMLNAINDVLKIAVRKYNSGEAANWDDYDDFIDLLKETISSYVRYCEKR